MTTISDKQIEGVSEKSKSKLGLRELLNPFQDQQYLSLPHILDQNLAPTQIYRQEGPNALFARLRLQRIADDSFHTGTVQLSQMAIAARCKSRTLHIFALQKIAACRGPIGPLPGKKRAKPFG